MSRHEGIFSSFSLKYSLKIYSKNVHTFPLSRHVIVGVSCDSCLKSNFHGRRYKCLICYDYDLCADCYEEGVTSTRHLVDHPMQCILTRSDVELYFGGEMLNTEQPQSFTCPFCKKMGFSDATLLEHVSTEHTETSLEVVCPLCAGHPGGEPNLVTDDFAGHLSIEHRTGPRELISFLISFSNTHTHTQHTFCLSVCLLVSFASKSPPRERGRERLGRRLRLLFPFTTWFLLYFSFTNCLMCTLILLLISCCFFSWLFSFLFLSCIFFFFLVLFVHLYCICIVWNGMEWSNGDVCSFMDGRFSP